jgi:hypothetical protein
MISTNPHDPPHTESEIETVTPSKAARHSVRDFVRLALLAGAGIGGGIGFLRLLVEGFYWSDAARDLLVGGAVGIVVGIGWFLAHRLVLSIRTIWGVHKTS